MSRIPKIIHYCWFGGAEIPELAEKCIASWKEYMPDWKYMRWDEASLTQAIAKPNLNPSLKGRTSKQPQNQSQDLHSWLDYMPTYVRQAYEARKYAFVSDYVRLWVLEKFGGLYMDVDFMVYRPFDILMDKYAAFAGYEGSKRNPVMQGVIASEAHGAWVTDMLRTYDTRVFIKEDGSLDMTPNTGYFTDRLKAQGFVADGKEKDFTIPSLSGESANIPSLHIFPVHYFCPVLTTGEDVRTPETYCEHKGESSWAQTTWKAKVLGMVSPKMRTKLIKLKRRILG